MEVRSYASMAVEATIDLGSFQYYQKKLQLVYTDYVSMYALFEKVLVTRIEKFCAVFVLI